MAIRTVTSGAGAGLIEVTTYRDGVEISRVTRPKKNQKPKHQSSTTTTQPSDSRPPCLHLNKPTGEEATVICISCGGKRKERQYPIHQCAVLIECLPNYQCTRESKEALSEWMEKSGRTVEIATCRGCEHFQPKEPH